MYFDMGSEQTYEEIGAKDVLATTTGHDKLRFTVVLTVSAAGKKLKSMIIFKNLKNIPKLKSTEKWPTGKFFVTVLGLNIVSPSLICYLVPYLDIVTSQKASWNCGYDPTNLPKSRSSHEFTFYTESESNT